MPSDIMKCNLWDFFRRLPDRKNAKQIQSFLIFSPLVLTLMRQEDKGIFPEELLLVQGKDLTEDWIIDNWLTPSLFSECENFLVLDAEGINSDLAEFLRGKAEKFCAHIFFVFNKDVPWRKRFCQEVSGDHFQIEAPKFWETKKLLSFLLQELQIRMDMKAQDIFLERLCSDSPLRMYHRLQELQHFYSGKNSFGVEDIDPILPITGPDTFVLAKLFSRKEQSLFYGKLLDFIADSGLEFNELRQIFSFMQGHLLKILYPDYLQQKDRLSPYDEGIKDSLKLWGKSELLEFIRDFSELEIMSKEQNPKLLEELRLRYLKNIV